MPLDDGRTDDSPDTGGPPNDGLTRRYSLQKAQDTPTLSAPVGLDKAHSAEALGVRSVSATHKRSTSTVDVGLSDAPVDVAKRARMSPIALGGIDGVKVEPAIAISITRATTADTHDPTTAGTAAVAKTDEATSRALASQEQLDRTGDEECVAEIIASFDHGLLTLTCMQDVVAFVTDELRSPTKPRVALLSSVLGELEVRSERSRVCTADASCRVAGGAKAEQHVAADHLLPHQRELRVLPQERARCRAGRAADHHAQAGHFAGVCAHSVHVTCR
jgi:hypothetical protein